VSEIRSALAASTTGQGDPAAAFDIGRGLIEDAGVVYHVSMKVDADLRQRRFPRLAPTERRCTR
jgi:hypothetical protein